MKTPKYKIKEVAKNVFLVTFKSSYDLAMTFLRYQEFYESPKWRGKKFTILEYMEWYSKEVGANTFSYPDDYDGFNLPSWVFEKIRYEDGNIYDVVMTLIRAHIKHTFGVTGPYYLIGVSEESGDQSTVRHEIAHGMYTTDPIYKKTVDHMVRKVLPRRVRRRLFMALKQRQYHNSVLVDESNAFLSTGLHSTWKLPGMAKYRRKFQKVFEAFYKKNKVR